MLNFFAFKYVLPGLAYQTFDMHASSSPSPVPHCYHSHPGQLFYLQSNHHLSPLPVYSPPLLIAMIFFSFYLWKLQDQKLLPI